MKKIGPSALALEPVYSRGLALNDVLLFNYERQSFQSTLMIIVDSGSLEFSFTGVEKDKLSSGELLLCPPNTEFSKYWGEPVSMLMLHYNRADIPVDSFGKYPFPNDSWFRYGILMYRKSCETGSFLPTNIRAHFAVALWYHAVISLCSPSLLSEYAHNDEALQNILGYIEENLDRQITLSELARRFGYSEQGIIGKFKDVLFTSPHRYMITRRMALAQRLLLSGDLSLCDIARRCGYDNEFYFSRAFKNYFGSPPSQYRKVNKYMY